MSDPDISSLLTVAQAIEIIDGATVTPRLFRVLLSNAAGLRLAWLAWLLVHLIFLIGFRNKIAVLLQWAYSYFAYKRSARIITGLPESRG